MAEEESKAIMSVWNAQILKLANSANLFFIKLHFRELGYFIQEVRDERERVINLPFTERSKILNECDRTRSRGLSIVFKVKNINNWEIFKKYNNYQTLGKQEVGEVQGQVIQSLILLLSYKESIECSEADEIRKQWHNLIIFELWNKPQKNEKEKQLIRLP